MRAGVTATKANNAVQGSHRVPGQQLAEQVERNRLYKRKSLDSIRPPPERRKDELYAGSQELVLTSMETLSPFGMLLGTWEWECGVLGTCKKRERSVVRRVFLGE
jgi:hypothetical protein